MTRLLKNAEIARQSNSWHFAERTVIGTISKELQREERTEQNILIVL